MPTSADAQGDMRAAVENYYGEELSESGDLKTSACATSAAPSAKLAALVANLHEETRARYFGCGLIAPEQLEGASVLDLGCGAGRDVYVLSQLVGPSGRVVGVDMTDKQLEVAEKWREWHRQSFGHAQSNVQFIKGYLEDLGALGLPDASFDVAVSNCVINLATDKAATLAGVRRLLRPGGEFYFADVYADRPLTPEAQSDPVLYGECLGGALVWSDFLALARETGFAPPRLTAAAPIEAYSDEIKAAIGETRFVSATVRLFARPDEGKAAPVSVTYEGGVEGSDDDVFAFDLATRFEPEATHPLDGETASILRNSRFGRFFEFAPADGPSPERPQINPFEYAGRAASAPQGRCCG